MHDNLLGEFECYPIAKNMWDQLKNQFWSNIYYQVAYLELKVDAMHGQF